MCEVRKHSVPVGADTSKFRRKPEVVYNPFTEKEENIKRLFSDAEEEYKRQRSESNSYKRTVQKIYSISRQCEWEYFVTLTYDKEKIADRYDYDICVNKLSKWLNNQRRLASGVQYLFVPEQHKDGAWHFHGLLANTQGMDIGRVSRLVKRVKTASGKWVTLKEPMKLYNVGGWHFGFSDASRVEDVQRISSYIVKYITKDLCANTKGRKRYFASRNIPSVDERKFYASDVDLFVNELIEQNDFELTYSKLVKGEYGNTEYIFLN